MSKKLIIIVAVFIALGVAGVIGKTIYEELYNRQVANTINETIRGLGLHPDDYNIQGIAPDKIREEIARQEIEKELQKMGIPINSVDLSGIDFSNLTYNEIYKIVYERVLAKETAKLQPGASPVPAAPAPIAGVPGVMSCASGEKIPREFNSEPYYTGPLFDAHIHVPVSSDIVSTTAKQLGFEDMPAFGGTLSTEYLSCLFANEGIRGAIGFFMATKYSLDQEVGTAKTFKQNYNGLAPFFMPAPFDQLRVDVNTIKTTLTAQNGIFEGIGELKIFDGTNIDNPHYTELYAIASTGSLVIMVHPFAENLAALEQIITKYPNIKFLLHGGESIPQVMNLMKSHANIYYSLDANLTRLYGWEAYHAAKGPTKDEYVSYIRKNFNAVLEKELATWKPYIEQHPGRFVWGTDRWYGWHFDASVGALVEEFGRSFTGKLAPTVQEAFAYRNAERLLGR